MILCELLTLYVYLIQSILSLQTNIYIFFFAWFSFTAKNREKTHIRKNPHCTKKKKNNRIRKNSHYTKKPTSAVLFFIQVSSLFLRLFSSDFFYDYFPSAFFYRLSLSPSLLFLHVKIISTYIRLMIKDRKNILNVE